jgi:uncharacterized protein (TIGR03083 family)
MPTTTPLLPSRTEIIAGMLEEYDGFTELLGTLSADDWTTATRCGGAPVQDVAGHVVGIVEDVAAGTPGSRTFEQEAAAMAGNSPAEAAARLEVALGGLRALATALDDDDVWNGPSGAPDLTMAKGVLTLWYDTYVHADDIRAALGRPTETGAGERGSLGYVAEELAGRGFGPARVEFTERDHPALELGAVDATTPTHQVDPHAFLLAATGRLDAATIGLDPSVNIYAE